MVKFNAVLDELSVYEAGKPIELVVRDYGLKPEDIVKLASNENPHGTSPKVVEAIKEYAPMMYRYPDDSFFELKEGLAKFYNVESDNIIIGCGSDQVLEFATRAKLSVGSKVLMNSITFAMYEIYAKQCGAAIIRTTSRHHDLKQFTQLYKEHKPEMIFLCVPNNPTGDCLSKEEVYSFLDDIDSSAFVIVDAAYMEYAAFKDPAKKIDPRDLIDRYPNVLFLGTFSKAYGLGGMRVGYGIAKNDIITTLFKLRPPFNITNLTLKAAIIALQDQEFVTMSIADCFKEMKRYEDFALQHGMEFIPSYTNFITILTPQLVSKEVSIQLLQKGVIVRDMTGYGLNALRVTIGTKEQNDRFFEVLSSILEG